MSDLPTELRRVIRKAVKSAHAAAYADGYAAGVEDGKREAEERIIYGLKSLASLNGSGAAVMAVTTPEAFSHEFQGEKPPYQQGGSRVEKAFDEAKHPRGDDGRFIDKQHIQAAARDPRKAAELRAKVTDPEQRAKLDAAISEQQKTGQFGGWARAAAEKPTPDPTADQPAEPTDQQVRGARNQPASEQPKPTVDESAALVSELMAPDGPPTADTVRQLTAQFSQHTHAELAELKQRLGIKASGNKAEQARKIAERAASGDRTNRQQYAAAKVTVDDAHATVEAMRADGRLGTPEGVRELAKTLGGGLTKDELHDLKRRLGVKASGAKADVARKIAERAGAGTPVITPANSGHTDAELPSQQPQVRTQGDRPKVEYVRAAAGGQVSDVDGRFYAGGQLMPVHGKYSGMAKPPKGEGVGVSSSPAKVNEDAEGGAGRRTSARPLSADELAEKKLENDRQAKWDAVNRGPLGQVSWLGERPNSKAGSGVQYDKWREFAAKIGPEGVKRVIAALEPQYHAAVERDVRPQIGVPSHTGRMLTEDDLEYYKGEPKQQADDDVSMFGAKAKKHEREVPGSHYARQLVSSMMHEAQHPKGTHIADRLHAVHEALTGALAPTA